MELILGQINAQRSSAAAADLENIFKRKDLDVLCIQEPYNYKNKVRGYTSPGIKILQPTEGYPWVAAVVKSKNIEVLAFPGNNEHIMCFQVITGNMDFFVINVYCQFSRPLEPFLEQINDLLNKLRGKKILITMDSNAWSETWHSQESNERGRLLEEFITINDLYIMNRPGNIPTFVTSVAESNIDLTLTNYNLMTEIDDWSVSDECNTSDHNLILFKIKIKEGIKNKNKNNWLKMGSYNIKKANWERFEAEIKVKFDKNNKNRLKNEPPNIAVKIFNRLLEQCCRAAIPEKKTSIKSVPWWNTELNEQRKKVKNNKKQLLRARRLNYEELIEQYTKEYKKSRNRYVAMIKRTKKSTWKNFVSVHGNNDPWSIVYKIIRNKIKKDICMSSVVLPTGNITLSWKETMEALINKCVPGESVNNLSETHKEIKRQNNEYYNSNLEPDIELDEIAVSIKKCKFRKAPGPDGFSAEIISKLWTNDKEILYNLYNNCFRNSIFPTEWKKAKLKIILKEETRDRTQLNSYRPIALLAVAGKIFERILIKRIQLQYIDRGLENSSQFGFRPKKSTEDALISLRKGIIEVEKKYVIGIFVDIEAAFDHLWWPAITNRLIRAECSSVIVKIMKSYLHNRRMTIASRFEEISRKMSRGCPQGSVAGPMAWGWCMDPLLDRLQAESEESNIDAEYIAYADDLAMIIKGSSRVELERYSEKILKILTNWCDEYKLKVSLSKTTAMMLKGRLNKDRLPNIKINNEKIKFKTCVKYLGMIVDEKLSFVEQAKYLRNKILKLTMALRRVTRETWGLKSHIINIMYSAVVLPMTNYGSGIWFDAVQKTHVIRHLLATQRLLLLIMTRACKTTATVAMQVIAGTIPLDLSIIQHALINRVKRNITTIWKTYEYYEREILEQNLEDKRITEETKKIEEVIYKEWQNRWDLETKGRNTYQYIKDVKFAKNSDWFRPGRYLVYMITGYGPINSSLYKRRSINFNKCQICQMDAEETTEHMLYKCPEYQQYRYLELVNTETDTDKTNLISTRDRYKKFLEFTVKIFEKRKERIHELESRGSASPGQGRTTSGASPDG